MSNPSAKPQGRQRVGPGGYEQRDANAKWIFGIVAFLIVAGLIMHFCLAGVMAGLGKKRASTDALTGLRRDTAATEINPAVPHLQIAPAEDLKRLREREEVQLTTYGWINRTAGVVRIPVEQAMELVLKRGLPVRQEGGSNQLGPSSYELQQKRPQFTEPEVK
jgi:hypothetical protein